MLTCDQPWQRAFAARLARKHELALVVVDDHFSSGSRTDRVSALWRQPLALAGRVAEKLALGALDARDAQIYADHFDRVGAPPFDESAKGVLVAPEINAAAVREAIDALDADAVLVSGTRLLREPVLGSRSRLGMVNMHTGLSPYYRGGPCTFWTLFNEEPEYAGVTIHHLSAGIDSGDIILSGRPALDERDGVASLDSKVIDVGHGLMLRALDLLDEGRAPRVRQWDKGKLFLWKQRTVEARLGLELRLADGLMSRCLRRLRDDVSAVRIVDA
jgi:methionyl-tRNA formyltransferase